MKNCHTEHTARCGVFLKNGEEVKCLITREITENEYYTFKLYVGPANYEFFYTLFYEFYKFLQEILSQKINKLRKDYKESLGTIDRYFKCSPVKLTDGSNGYQFKIDEVTRNYYDLFYHTYPEKFDRSTTTKSTIFIIYNEEELQKLSDMVKLILEETGCMEKCMEK